MRPPHTPVELQAIAQEHADRLAPAITRRLAQVAKHFVDPNWQLLCSSLSAQGRLILTAPTNDLIGLETTHQWAVHYSTAVNNHVNAIRQRRAVKKSDEKWLRGKLYSAFNYAAFSRGTGTWGAYLLAERLGMDVCPYCNRDYITVMKPRRGEGQFRPDFDHWFARSNHPWFGLSFYNLVPSCATCNSRMKLNKSYHPTTHANPLIEDLDSLIEFAPALPPASNNGDPRIRYPAMTVGGRDYEVTLEVRPREGADPVLAAKAIQLMQDMRVVRRYLHTAMPINHFLTRLRNYPESKQKSLARELGTDIANPFEYREWKIIHIGATGRDDDVEKRPFGKLFNDLVRDFEANRPQDLTT
jgi:hypothetical protein